MGCRAAVEARLKSGLGCCRILEVWGFSTPVDVQKGSGSRITSSATVRSDLNQRSLKGPSV